MRTQKAQETAAPSTLSPARAPQRAFTKRGAPEAQVWGRRSPWSSHSVWSTISRANNSSVTSRVLETPCALFLHTPSPCLARICTREITQGGPARPLTELWGIHTTDSPPRPPGACLPRGLCQGSPESVDATRRLCVFVTGEQPKTPRPQKAAGAHGAATSALEQRSSFLQTQLVELSDLLTSSVHVPVSFPGNFRSSFHNRDTFIIWAVNPFSQPTICLCLTMTSATQVYCSFSRSSSAWTSLLHKDARARHRLIRDHTMQTAECHGTLPR